MADKKKDNKHTNKTSFQKGRSGNPGGRSPRIGPNGETAAQLARAHTVEAIDCLVEITNSRFQPARDRVAAAIGLLDRGWGKPTEYIGLDETAKAAVIPVIQIVRVESDGSGAD